METRRTPVSRWGGERQKALQARTGRISAVREIEGVPVGVYDVVLDNDQQLSNVPMLLPASGFLFAGGKRQHGASGLVPIASVGDNCLVIYVGTQQGMAQPFILGFFAPRREDGSDYQNPKRVRPGSLVMMTPYGNGIVLRNGGIIEIEAEPHVKRVMTPAAANATDGTGSMIADRCRNYRLLTAAGEARMGEVGNGRSSMKFKVREFSSFGNGRVGRAAASLGQSTTGGEAHAVNALPGEPQERFVEVTWGSAGGGQLARELYSGPSGDVEVTQDGAGGMRVNADRTAELSIAGGIVVVTASSDGLLRASSVEQQHLVTGSVSYDVSGTFDVLAPVTNLFGRCVIGGGGLPSARMGDLVLVGNRVGEILTGRPNLIH